MASAKEIADMFDEVEVGTSDYSRSNEKELRPFEARVEDIQAVMDNEMPFEEDADIIENAVQAAVESPPPPATDETFDKDYEAVVDADMKEFEIEEPKPERVVSLAKDDEFSEDEPLGHPAESKDEEIPDKHKETIDDNPLDLSASDLEMYNKILEKLPQFTLYDGNVSFKDFYRYKFSVLRSAAGRFTILNLKQMGEEIGTLKLDHYIGDRAISPELLRRRLDDAYRYRVRLSTIMIKLFEQHPWWERNCEMLKAKLWKDHELKGTHRRDGLTMEHMQDIEDYLHYMVGIIDGAKHADNMLKAATESLSRQLSCLQIKEATGFSTKMEPEPETARPVESQSPGSSALDGLDSIESSNVVGVSVAPSNTESVLNVGDDDELTNL